jgi:hypothetical protein
MSRFFHFVGAAALLLLFLSSSCSSAEPSSPPTSLHSDLERAVSSSIENAADVANILTFSPEQISAAESALNSTASAVFAAVNATKNAKAQFFQDAIATPFGQLKAGGLRAGGLVKRTNRTSTEKAEWLTSELALAPFARAFSQVSAAVGSSPVGKAFAATTKEPAAAAGEGPEFALPTPGQVLSKVGSELRLPGGGPAEDLSAAVAAAEAGKKGSAAAVDASMTAAAAAAKP